MGRMPAHALTPVSHPSLPCSLTMRVRSHRLPICCARPASACLRRPRPVRARTLRQRPWLSCWSCGPGQSPWSAPRDDAGAAGKSRCWRARWLARQEGEGVAVAHVCGRRPQCLRVQVGNCVGLRRCRHMRAGARLCATPMVLPSLDHLHAPCRIARIDPNIGLACWQRCSVDAGTLWRLAGWVGVCGGGRSAGPARWPLPLQHCRKRRSRNTHRHRFGTGLAQVGTGLGWVCLSRHALYYWQRNLLVPSCQLAAIVASSRVT